VLVERGEEIAACVFILVLLRRQNAASFTVCDKIAWCPVRGCCVCTPVIVIPAEPEQYRTPGSCRLHFLKRKTSPKLPTPTLLFPCPCTSFRSPYSRTSVCQRQHGGVANNGSNAVDCPCPCVLCTNTSTSHLYYVDVVSSAVMKILSDV
jgi:hypothetical protein